ncbi:MAG TPA: ParB/RepB/Spo0J family partition protein [Burkholderiales bacterium]
MITELKLELLVLDEHLYPRNGISTETVGMLVDAIESGAELPPILVENGTHRIVDGAHRADAYRRMGRETIRAEVRKFANDAELLAEAIRMNRAHGRPLDRYDLTSCMQRLQEMGFTRERISEVVRMPVDKLAHFAKGFANTAAGEAVPIKRGLEHLRGQTLTAPQIQAVEKYGGMHASFYANQLLLLLENNMLRETPQLIESMDRLCALWGANRSKSAA